MLPVRKAIPLYNHASLTYKLKIGCRDTYARIRENVQGDVRDLEVRSTRDIDPELLKACVDFVSLGWFDYAKRLAEEVVSIKKPLPFFPTKNYEAAISQAHTDTMMMLRSNIVGGAHQPWNEEEVHFWGDFEVLYHHMDVADKKQVDDFFVLLMNQPFHQLALEHSISTQAPLVPLDQHPYQSCPHLSSLVRSDVAANQFSIVVGSENIIPVHIGNEDDCFGSMLYDDFGDDWGAENTTERQYLKKAYSYPELESFAFGNPGQPFKSFTDAVVAAFENQVSKAGSRRITINHRGKVVLKGDLNYGSFTPNEVNPTNLHGVKLTRQYMLDTLSAHCKSLGMRHNIETLFSADLGL